MSSSSLSLSSFKVPVGSGCTTFPGSEPVIIHRQTHGTARLTPFETCLDENLVQAFLFRLLLDQPGTGNDHGQLDVGRPLFSLDHSCSGSQVFNARIGTRADEYLVDGNGWQDQVQFPQWTSPFPVTFPMSLAAGFPRHPA